MQQTIPTNDRIIASVVGTTPSSGPFTVDFPFFSLDDVIVELQPDGSDVWTVLIRGADYSLDGVATEDGSFSSGTITLVLPIVSTTIRRYGRTTIERLSNFPLQGFFSRLALNAELNRLTVVDQEFSSRMATIDATASANQALTLKIPSNEAALGLDITAAAAGSRAGRVLAWDSAGNLIESGKTLSQIENPPIPVSPPGSLTGLGYKSVRWYGAVLDGVTNDTVAFQAALNSGGTVIVDGPAVISNITLSAAGTILQLTGSTLTGLAGATGTMITASGARCRIVGPGTIDCRPAAYAIGVTFSADDCALSTVNILGNLFKPRTPMAADPTPARLVNVRPPADTTVLAGISVRNVTMTGGTSGISFAGTRDSECIDCTGFYQTPGLAFYFNYNGFPSVNTMWRGLTAVGSGYYGLSCTNLAQTAVDNGWGVPIQGMHLTEIRARHCAWATYYGTTGQTPYTSKFGMDWTDTWMTRGNLQAEFWNNCVGGIEIKGGEGIGTIVSQPHQFNALYANIKCWHAMDYGDGVAPCSGTTTKTAEAMFYNCIIDSDTWYIGCQPWKAGLRQEVWSPVSSNGWQWLCLGDVNGAPGIAGATAPTGGGAKVTSTVGVSNAGQPNIVVASEVGIAIGQTVFINGSTGQTGYVADGLTVTAINAGTKTITLSANILVNIPASRNIIFAQEHFDGTLYWRAFEAAPASDFAGVSCTGVSTLGTKGLTLRGSATNTRYGVLIDGFTTSDKAVLDCSIMNFKMRGVVTGVQLQSSSNNGTGTTQVDLINCDIDASSTAVASHAAINIGSAQTSRLRIYGGHISVVGGSSQGIRCTDTSSTNASTTTIELHGGVVIESPGSGILLSGSATDFTKQTFNLDLDNCSITGITPLNYAGQGTLKFGPACQLTTTSNTPGYKQTVGTGVWTVTGSYVRGGRTTAPAPTTQGNIGEKIILAVPTATEWGYYCIAADFLTPTFTWKKLTLT